MTKLQKTYFMLAPLAVFALAGCGDPSADNAGSAPVTESPTATQTASEPDAAAADSNGAAQPEGKRLTARDRMDQIREQTQARFKPEVIGPALEENFAQFQETLSGITDKESATEALPKLKGFSSAITQMNAFVPLVPPESRETIVEKLTSARDPLQQSIDKLKENEEIAAVISPVLDGAMVYYGMIIDKLSVQPANNDEAETESDAATESDEDNETEE